MSSSRSCSDDLRAKGVILTDLHTAAREHPELVQRYLSVAVKPDEWKYVALNAALWTGGCFLYVPKDVVIDLPVQLSTVVGAEGARGLPAHDHRRRTRAAASSSSMRRCRPTRPDKTFVSGAVEIYAGDGAHVEYYSVNRWGHGVSNFNTVRAMRRPRCAAHDDGVPASAAR